MFSIQNADYTEDDRIRRYKTWIKCLWLTRGKRKGGDSGTPVLAIFNNIQRVDKFGAINSPSTLTTIRYAPF